jgi:hypothetical protein
MELVRDRSLDYSALRFTATIPITWMTGIYKLKKGFQWLKCECTFNCKITASIAPYQTVSLLLTTNFGFKHSSPKC